jgi:saccharopine dehydrogenase (NAD+, L-lysine-forming)
MRVLVLGTGAVGTVVAREMARSKHFHQVVLADRDVSRARSLAAELGDRRFQALKIDAGSRSEVAAAARGVDLIVNLVIPRLNLTVMEAALDAGAHYLDTASDGPVPLPGRVDVYQQMALNDRFRSRGRCALLCMGADPGASNIFARWAADRLDTVESIRVRDADVSTVEGVPFAMYFSPDTVIEECLQPPLRFVDGRFVQGEPLTTGVETHIFPEPIGAVTVYAVSHEEAGTIPLHIKQGLRHCDFKYALPDELVNVLKVLRLLGLDRADPVDVGGNSVSPRGLVTALLPPPADLGGKVKGWSLIGTLVKGMKDGESVEHFVYTLNSHEESYAAVGATATAHQVAVPLVVAAELLAEGMIEATGVVLPECLDPEPFMTRLPGRGFPIYLEERRSRRLMG